MARYEEERYGGRGSARRGAYNERGRDEDFEQQERDRYRSSEYGREYNTERDRGMDEGSWRSQGGSESGRSLGGRESYEGYDEGDTGSSYSAGGREGNRYGSPYRQGERYQSRTGGQGRGFRDYNPSQGFGFSPERDEGTQRYQGSTGYQGSQGYGQASPFYGQGSQGYGQGSQGYGQTSRHDENQWQRGQGTTRGGQGSWSSQQQYGQTGRSGSQADGWSGEPDEMRWGRQQGLYGSSEYGGYISSQRSQRDYQSHVGKGPKGWQRSDERIREDVNETLARHPEIDASEIEVRVQNCEVTLTGNVDDRRTKRLAEDIVENVFGVKDVENKIKVKGGLFGFLSGDKDVTAKADRERDTESQEATTRRTTAATTGTTGSTPR